MITISSGPMDLPPWTFEELKKLDQALANAGKCIPKTDKELYDELAQMHEAESPYKTIAQKYYPK